MIDQIILSSNENKTYIEFWEPISQVYKKMFPGIKVHLAFLSPRREDDHFVKYLRRFGDVTLFNPLPEIQEFAQAKLIRFILASRQKGDVCYIDDIDLFPLRREFITEKTDRRPKDHILCVGGEVYENNGCYPISQMTAEGYVWKQLINPNDLFFWDLMKYWQNMQIVFNEMEDLNCPTNWYNWTCFSDEKFLRKLRHLNKQAPPIFELPRGYNDYLTATLDRAKWNLDLKRLKNHEYQNAHGRRPYSMFAKDYEPLIEYINQTYA